MPFILTEKILKPIPSIWHLKLLAKMVRMISRPDIVVFVNGLPLSYIEVKQPNAIRDGKTGIQSEQDRTRYRFENRKFRRF